MTVRSFLGLGVMISLVACSAGYTTVGTPPQGDSGVASSGADLSICATWSASQERCQSALSPANLTKCEVIVASAACGALYHDAIKCHADALTKGGLCFDLGNTRCAAQFEAYDRCTGPNGLEIVRTCEGPTACSGANVCTCSAGLHKGETCRPSSLDAGACTAPTCLEICTRCD